MKYDVFKKNMGKCGSKEFGNEGFSLIEVLLAMAILSIGLLGVLSLHLNTSKFNTKGNVATMANMIAQKKVEAVCSGKISDVTSQLSKATAGGFLIEDFKVNSDGKKDQADGIFTVQTRIFTFSEPDYAKLRRVNVTVLWNRGGSAESISYSAVTRGSTIEI